MTNNNNTCPCCHKHCGMDNLECNKGVEYAQSERTVDEKLFSNMRNCAHILRHNAEGKGGQSRILSILHHKGHMTQRELMDVVDVSSASLSEVLSKIEAHGFVLRNRNDEDKRNVDITLTDAGAQEAEKSELTRTQSSSELFSCLSDDEKTQLLELLEKLSDNWKSRFGENVHGAGCQGLGHGHGRGRGRGEGHGRHDDPENHGGRRGGGYGL